MANEDVAYRKRFASPEKDVLKQIQKIHQGKDSEVTKQRFLVEIRKHTDKAEGELSDCLKTGKNKPSCYMDYGSSMYKLNDLIKNTKDLGKLKPFYFPCIPELIDEETQRHINQINNVLKDRTSYGLREEIAEKKSIILAWSNANMAWYPYGKTQENIKTGKEEYSYMSKKNMKIKLDANQILVPVSDNKDNKDNKDLSLDKLGHAASCANPHPLYKISFEAVHERRETPFLLGLFTWLERQTARLKEKEERERYA